MTISEIRRANARALVSRIKGGQAELARRANMSDSQVSQLLGDNSTKNIGNLIARRIETVFELPKGWLDTLHSDSEISNVLPMPAKPDAQADAKPSITPFYIDPEEIALINGYRNATPAGKLSIRAAVEAAKKLN
jgi:hypothetical protein